VNSFCARVSIYEKSRENVQIKFGEGLLTPPRDRPQVSRTSLRLAGAEYLSALGEIFGPAPWHGPPLVAVVPETGHNVGCRGYLPAILSRGTNR
jgi:hypothetical protein